MLFCDGSEGQPGTRHGGRGKMEFCQCDDGDRDGKPGCAGVLHRRGMAVVPRTLQMRADV